MDSPLITKYGAQKRWVCWKYEERDGKRTKVPYSPSGKHASSTDSTTWCSIEEAKSAVGFDGIGIVFTEDKLLLGIDLDHIFEAGFETPPYSLEFIKKANTYTEWSPSKTGLHIYLELTEPFEPIAKSKKIGKYHPEEKYENYTSGRYFTVTNESYGEKKPIRTVTPQEAEELLGVLGYPWKSSSEKAETTPFVKNTLDDEALIQKMFSSKNGVEIDRLWYGDITRYGNDDSAADMALCCHLAFWTNKNKVQMIRLWRSSPLGSRIKTSQRDDYVLRTVEKACAEVQGTYAKNIDVVSNGSLTARFSMKEQQDEDSEFKNRIYENGFKNKFRLKEDRPKISYQITQWLVDKYHIKTIGKKREGREVYVYKNGIYVTGENILRNKIQIILEEFATTYYKKEIIDKIMDVTLTDREIFNPDSNLINLNNGVLDVRTGELSPHTPNQLFLSKIPVTFDPNADCKKIKKFLSEILQESDISVLQELIGYTLYRKYHIKKGFIFVGGGNTGKTTILELLNRFIGMENVSGISLQKLSSDKFAIAPLYNKHINIYDDLSAKDIIDTGAFKIATGGGHITGEFKYGHQFRFLNFAKFIFACNKIPNVKDTNDDAYFSRWIVIEFKNVIKEIEMDKKLIDKLTTSEELSGLLNFAFEGLQRLLKYERFSYNKNPDEIKIEMLGSGSVIAKFAFDCLEDSTDSWISKQDMYNAYISYARNKKEPVETIVKFGKRLPKYAEYIVDSKGTDPKTRKQIEGWRNVTLISSSDNIESESSVENDELDPKTLF